MRKLFFITVIICLSAASSLSASEKERAAVLGFESQNCPKVIATAVTDMLAAKIYEQRLYTLIEREQINMIFKELELQQTGCTDAACAVKIGQMLSANKIIQGSVYKMDVYVVVVKIVNVADNKVAGTYKAESNTSEEIESAVDEIVDKIKFDFNTDIFFSASISAGYRYPMGDLSKAVDGGYGVTLAFDVNNLIFKGGILSFCTGFSFFQGKEGSVESIMSIPGLLYYGYTINVSRNFKLIPYIGVGYVFHMMSYDKDNYDQFGDYEYTRKTYLDPSVSAKIDIAYVITPFLHFVISPYYTYLFEKDKTGQILFADVGIRMLF